jgi:hypothetical protein
MFQDQGIVRLDIKPTPRRHHQHTERFCLLDFRNQPATRSGQEKKYVLGLKHGVPDAAAVHRPTARHSNMAPEQFTDWEGGRNARISTTFGVMLYR